MNTIILLLLLAGPFVAVGLLIAAAILLIGNRVAHSQK